MGDRRRAEADHRAGRRARRRGLSSAWHDRRVPRRTGARPGAGDQRQPRARLRRARPGPDLVRRRGRPRHRRRPGRRRGRRGRRRWPATRRTWSCGRCGRPSTGSAASRPGSSCRAPTASRTAAGWARRRRRSSPACCWPARWSSAATRRCPTPTAFALAAELEGHPDNVAACLLGGLTVAWTDGRRRPRRAQPKSTSRRAAGGARAAVRSRPPRPRAACCRRSSRTPTPRSTPARRPCSSRCSPARRRHRCAAGRHRGPAAPAVPGRGDAGDARRWSPAARRRAGRGGVRRRTDRAGAGSR